MCGDIEIVDPQLDGDRSGGALVADERHRGIQVGERMLERRTGAHHGPVICRHSRDAEDRLANDCAVARRTPAHRGDPLAQPAQPRGLVTPRRAVMDWGRGGTYDYLRHWRCGDGTVP